jgi:predicted PurR-regulated permease PerM
MIADTFRQLWNTTPLRVVFLVACGYLMFVALRLTSVAWTSFLIAFLIAYLVEPLVVRLERRRIPRWLSMTLVMTFIVLLVLLSVFITGDILAQLVNLPRVLVPFLDELPARLEALSPPWLETFFDENTTALPVFLENQQATLLNWFQNQTRSLWGKLGAALTVFGNVIVILFLTAFMISGYPAIRGSLLAVVPRRYGRTAADLTAKLDCGASVMACFRCAGCTQSRRVGLSVCVTQSYSLSWKHRGHYSRRPVSVHRQLATRPRDLGGVHYSASA